MAIGQPTRPAQRYAFWVTGVVLFVCWQLGAPGRRGALAGRSIPPDFGLEAAAPAVFLALLWPALQPNLGPGWSRWPAPAWHWPWCRSRHLVCRSWPPRWWPW